MKFSFLKGDSESATEDGFIFGSSYSSPATAVIPETPDATDGTPVTSYQPVVWHWFFLKETEKSKRLWKPFSMLDSVALEDVFQLRNDKS